ncbi:MAG: hypothetical protein KF805_10065 [Phycisphaeraceae bacterium]|nr:hypothetical protein [Phycisphaeraceae bacterium]
MDHHEVSRINLRCNAGAISLTDLMSLWLGANIARVRVDLVRRESCIFGPDDTYSTATLGMLFGVRVRKTPSCSGALQAVERNRLDRISYADFVIRIARSGYASFAVFTRQNIISFEGRGGELFSVPVFLLPERGERV